MSRSACLIFNPIAGQGDPEQELERIQAILTPELDLDVRLTTKEIGADRLAQEAVEKGYESVIVSGGDGTVSAAAAALMRTGIPLGVIARGTANAFANALGIPTTLDAACQIILEGSTQKIDIASCNGLPMILLAGIGFEAETVALATREAKNRFGILAYVLSGLKQLAHLDRFEAEIETDDRIISVSASALTIANAAPATSVLAQGPAGLIVDDGLLDLTIIAPASRAGAIAATYHLLQSALSGNPTDRNDIGYLRSKRFKITTNPAQKVVLDGEIIGKTPVDVECVPAGLTIFMPATEEAVPTERLEGLPDLVIEPKE